MKNMKRLIVKGIFVLIVVLGMAFTSYAEPSYVGENGDSSTDVHISENLIISDIYGKWSQEAITYCAKQGYLEGMLVRNHWIYPNMPIDKSDLSLLLGRKAGIDYIQYKEAFFTDVRLEDYDICDSYNYSDWYRNVTPYYVNWAGKEGILKGSGQGALTGAELTREQAATIIDRFIEKQTNLYNDLEFDGTLPFKDQDQIASWAKEGVGRLTKLKIFNGDENGFFNPHQSINRAEICQIIFNLETKEY